jgi:hypothetical protein
VIAAPKLSASKAKPGARITISGKLGTRAKRPVTVQRSSGRGWLTAGRVWSNSKGNYKLRVKLPRKVGTYKFRVIAKSGRYKLRGKRRLLPRLQSRARSIKVRKLSPSAPPSPASQPITDPTPQPLTTPVTAAAPAQVNYLHDGPGSYIFVNAPEQLRTEHLADASYGNNLLYQGSVVKNGSEQEDSLIYFEHNNTTGRSIQYGIQFFNTTSEPITLNVTDGRGASNGWQFADTWHTLMPDYSYCENFCFFQSEGWAVHASYYSVPADGCHCMWFYLGRDSNGKTTIVDNIEDAIPIANGQAFDGTMGFVEPDTPIQVNIMAAADLSSLKGTATQKFARAGAFQGPAGTQYTATSKGGPFIHAELEWTITDDTSNGPLAVLVNGKAASSWVTNIRNDAAKVAGSGVVSADSPAVFSDMLSWQAVNGATFGPDDCNCANWGVHYIDAITITNKGSKTRKINYWLKGTPLGAIVGYAAYASPACDTSTSYGALDFNATKPNAVDVGCAIVRPYGGTTTLSVVSVLGGNSSNGIQHQVYLSDEEP